MSQSTDFIPFSRPSLGAREEQAVVEVIRSGWLTTGPQALAFETEFAAYVGCKHALAVCSATAGLHLSLDALGVGPGDLVITTPYTFTATAEVIRYLNADPLFVDIDKATYNIDPSLTARAIKRHGRRVKAVIPVHIGGLPCDLAGLREAVGSTPIVEDAAHAFPVKIDGRFVGTIGSIGVFSFYANKTITTGEGGMVTTNDDALAKRVQIMRSHGIDRQAWSRYTEKGASWRYAVVEAGYKYNMPDIAAAIGRVQLTRATEFQQGRTKVAEFYNRELSGVPFLQTPQQASQHAWHLYLLRLRAEKLRINRDEFIERMTEAGVGTSVHYTPLHMMPYYAKRYALSSSDFPVARDNYEQTISLPIYPALSPAEMARVVDVVRNIGYSSQR